jgi:peroxiredoxin
MSTTIMRRLAVLLLALTAISGASANVARWAPDFGWLKSGGARTTLKSLRGQPVVLVVAPSPEHWKFRQQAKELQKTYQLLGNDKAVMVAAFTGEPGVIRSNIPFVLAANPGAIVQSYGVAGDFAVFVIGRDGNLDEISDRVLPGQRVLDIINNSFVPQRDNRRAE